MFGIRTKLNGIKYRKMNKHNFTQLRKCTDVSRVKVGKGTYGYLDILTYGNMNSNLYIGNFCSIADKCVFLLGGEHKYNTLSTYPFKAKYTKEREAETKGDIIVGDDVWIGYGCTILSGVKIGQGAIIGAQSVVAKDIPPYAIYAGNKIIKYRFSDDVIKKLSKVDFSKLDEKKIKTNIEYFYKEIKEENVDEIIKKINL